MQMIMVTCFNTRANWSLAEKRRNPKESDARGNETARGARTLGSANPLSDERSTHVLVIWSHSTEIAQGVECCLKIDR